MANGILVIDKSEDWTSMDVCAKLRGIYKERRVGHGGTLDPMATGVLPVFLGRATRAVSLADGGPKEYEALLRLGVTTDTQDITGRVLQRREVYVDRAALEAVLPRFTGEIEQVPPMYSAVKINGQRLYKLARKGEEVARPARRITIHALEILGGEDTDWRLRVECSKGTYIRTLCHDIGAALGCGGTMAALRRTRACGFTADDAVRVETLASADDPQAYLLPTDALFRGYPSLTLPPAAERKLRCGAQVRCGGHAGVYRVYGEDGTFLALCEAGAGRLKTIKSFFEVSVSDKDAKREVHKNKQ